MTKRFHNVALIAREGRGGERAEGEMEKNKKPLMAFSRMLNVASFIPIVCFADFFKLSGKTANF